MTLHLHIIVLAALTLAMAVSTVIARSWYRKELGTKVGKRNPRWTYINYEKEDLPSFWTKWISLVLAGFMGLALVVSLIPFNPSYWFLTQHEGEIASLSNRFVDGTGDVSGRTYTLTLVGDPTPRVVTDSRILGLSVGDRVDLTCSLEWVYGGADINNCYMRSF